MTRSGNTDSIRKPQTSNWDFREGRSWNLADMRHAVCLVWLKGFRRIDPFSHHHQMRVKQREVKSLAQSHMQPVRGQAGQVQAASPQNPPVDQALIPLPKTAKPLVGFCRGPPHSLDNLRKVPPLSLIFHCPQFSMCVI